MNLESDVLKVCISKEEIEKIVSRIAKEINDNYKDKNPLFICLLKGAVPFMTDLLKEINVKCSIEYLKVSSYDGIRSTGVLKIDTKIPNVKGKDVIIVDDIIDTGKTLFELKKLIQDKGANTVSIAILLDKPSGRKYDIYADYIGTLVPNEFVVGYGLDYNEYYRNLPYIGVLKEEIYKK